MFKQLHALAKPGAIQLLLVAEGEQLRVTVTQKKSAAGGPLMISVLGTPADLDADLISSIEAAPALAREARPVKDQVADQVAKSAEKKPAAKAEGKPKKAAKPPKVKKAAKAPKPPKAKKAAKAAGPKVRLPGASPRSSAKPAAGKKTVTHRDSLPGKEECIVDYLAMEAKHGDKLNRQFFIDNSKTGRRFERLYGMSWTKFVMAAKRKAPAAGAAPDRDEKTLPLPLEDPGARARQREEVAERQAAAREAAARQQAAVPAPSTLPAAWPFPTIPKDVELGEDKNDTSHGHDVYDADTGVYLSSITSHPEVGGPVSLVSRDRPLTVVKIDGRRVFVFEKHKPATTESAAPQQQESASSAPSKEPAAAGAADAGRVIKLASGRILAGGYTFDNPDGLDLGTEVELPGQGKFRVIEFTYAYAIVEAVKEEAPV